MEEKNKKEIQKTTIGKFGILEISVLLILTCIFSMTSGLFLGNKFLREKEIAHDIPPELNEVIDNYNYIVENFYGDIDKKEIVKGAIKGMIDSLGDKYTSFLDQETSETFNIQLKGSFTGVGVEIVNSVEGITILSVMEDSPAEKVGLKKGDVLLEIDGTDVSDKSSSDFTDLVKQKDGKFEVLIKRGEEQLIKELYKDLVILKSVHTKTYEQKDKKIGYLEITLFASNTFEQFKDQLEKLEKENIDGLIIDVRWNSGGHLSSVEKMISLFLDASHVIYQTENKDGIEMTYSSGTVTKKYPVVLLSNGESASASELLMGALRDELDSIIVGTKSFGKGTVQELNKLTSLDQYKITTKKWLTPKGNSIDKIGLEPDIVIEQDPDYYQNFDESKDVQLKKALEIFSTP
ncbi:MAG: S41 family peptidase [Bacilli bacterium]|nr:S41 family peptidase [Bacilli bacterium]MDD4282193.1 S41 family peptidase [Bacilli bacterium]MDD4719198.1 S41 family peptidase [Bacilli bacterium]